jgi:hypothetical protein
MFEVLFTVVAVVAVIGPSLLLIAAAVWLFRSGAILRRSRRLLFLAGVTASGCAYAGHFLLGWYLRRAHLGFWPEVDAILGTGTVMLVASLLGIAACSFGKGFGRWTGCIGSGLVFVLWWLSGVAAL